MSVVIPLQEPLRPPLQVMRLARMGAMFPTRLSFLRTMLRKLSAERAVIERPVWDIDVDGYGHAVYTLEFGGHRYSLVAFSTLLDPAQRTDRVIAEAWDTAFVLYDGLPDDAEIARLRTNAPLQEAGRFGPRDLVLSRANKSVRLFAEVTQALRNGVQPDVEAIRQTGYLMRTTAVYGNGKFGIADRARIAGREGLDGPFMAEMLTVWLIRGFTHDLAEHVGGAKLDRHLKRHLGVGNSTGLGMAPFLVSHPDLLNNWMMMRETALARVRAIGRVSLEQIRVFEELGQRVCRHLEDWSVADEDHMARIERLRIEWADLMQELPELLDQPKPIDQMMKVAEAFSLDCQELMVSFVLEPFGDMVDGLTEYMGGSKMTRLDPRMGLSELQSAIETHFDWVEELDFDDPDQVAQFWYVSEEKQEPRLGLRHEEPGAELESPLDIARQVHGLARDLDGATGTLATFLLEYPQHRAATQRVQMAMLRPYGEIRDNLIDATCKPIDMLRCKLAFFGAAKFDPKSDRWTRIILAQGAPLFDELDDVDGWWMPVFSG